MSTFKYHKPGIGNASSYIVSGVPWYTSSLAPALSTTSKVVNFPRVTNYVVVKNNSTTDDILRFTFNNDNIVDNTNYITLEGGESFSGELRTTDVHFISDTETPVPFTVVAGLTNIQRQEMTQTTPTAPNLLAWVQKQKLTASSDAGPSSDYLGYSISMNSTGDILAIAAPGDEENDGTDAGSVYIFQSGSLGYQQVQKLTASGDLNPAGDSFGLYVSMNSTGDILAIGAPYDEENGPGAGSAYIFQSSSLGYQQVQKLTASGDLNPAGDYFGTSISINSAGDTLAIGAWGDEENGGANNAGSVYIFQSSSLGYQQVQKLTASGDLNPAGDSFGSYVSMNSTGDTLAIGAYNDQENGTSAGSVYIFQSSSLGYQQVQKLTASGDADPIFDYFGISISMNSTGDTLAIGAYNDQENGPGAGSAYIFQSSSLGYQQVQKLTASGDADPFVDYFGYSVSLNSAGDTLAIGAWGDEENGGANNAGSVYIFQSSSLGYQQVQKLTANFGTDGQPEISPESDFFSFKILMNSTGDILAIGATGDEGSEGPDEGSAYVFKYTRDY